MQAQIDIQQAIYNTLSNGLNVPVYDDVPQELTATDSGFPFVTIGDDTFNEGSTDTEGGFFRYVNITYMVALRRVYRNKTNTSGYLRVAK